MNLKNSYLKQNIHKYIGTYVKINNFRKLEDTPEHKSFFEKGTNIIVGKIGAGKSSIVDAICYSLWHISKPPKQKDNFG